MQININKEMFLEKNKFKAKKMSIKEFKTILYNKYIALYLRYERGIIKLDNENDIYNIVLAIGNYLENNSYELFEKLEHDFNIIGMGFDIMNWEDINDQFKIHVLDNGFIYISVYSSIGDDASAPIYYIIYFDEDYNLRAYCPLCGNLVFVGANVQMCIYGEYGNQEKESVKLFKEFKEKEPNDPKKYIEKFLDIYGKKYGCINKTKNICLEDLHFNIKLMKEDIKSNVILI